MINNNMKKLKCLVMLPAMVALLAILFIPTVTLANSADEEKMVKLHHGKQHLDQRFPHHLRKLIKKMELTPTQKEQIKALYQQEKSKKLHKKMKMFKQETHLLLQKDEFDADDFASLHQKYQPVLAELALKKAQNKHAILQLLTPEQRTKWLAAISARSKH